MARDSQWCASALALTEAQITLCHTGLAPPVLAEVLARLRTDWERMLVVPVDDRCLACAREIGCAQRVRTLDAVHLAAAERLPRPAVFMTFDLRQRDAAETIGLALVSFDAHSSASESSTFG